MKVYEVHRVYANGSSKWLATFQYRFNANDFVVFLKNDDPGSMFSITEVNK